MRLKGSYKKKYKQGIDINSNPKPAVFQIFLPAVFLKFLLEFGNISWVAFSEMYGEILALTKSLLKIFFTLHQNPDLVQQERI